MDATDEVRAEATSEARPSQLIHVFDGQQEGGGTEDSRQEDARRCVTP